MVTAWRALFRRPDAYFGFVQLSTWCTSNATNASIAQMRDAQLAALALPKVGFATNADHGFGCDIHPRAKQYVGARLGTSALALQYGFDLAWRSPSYASATATVRRAGASGAARVASVVVQLADVSARGLTTDVYPFNYRLSDQVPTQPPLNCSALHAGVCAWASLHLADLGWLNASVRLAPGGRALVLEAALPPAARATDSVLATSYGYGDIPLMNVYDVDTGLPVLPWNRSIGLLVED